MKIVANLANNCKNNVVKVSGEEGHVYVLQSLFEDITQGVILELLLRLQKYY